LICGYCKVALRIIHRNINVYIGQESSFDDLKDFTIITYKQVLNDKEIGTIGIIGPKRMDYKKVIPTIKYIGDILQEKINKERGGNKSDGKEE
jgi:heat-inducible transcriptional repressor